MIIELFSCQKVRGAKESQNHSIHVFGSHCVAINIEGWLGFFFFFGL